MVAMVRTISFVGEDQLRAWLRIEVAQREWQIEKNDVPLSEFAEELGDKG